MTRSIARVLTLALMATSAVFAQSRRALTSADYDRAVKMLAPALNGLVVGGTADANWLPDGRFWYVRTTLTGTQNVVIDPVKKTREVVATPPEGAQPARGGGAGGRGARGGGGGGGRGGRGGGVAVTKTCGPNVTGTTGVPPLSMSPDGTKGVFICDWNLWVKDTATRNGAPAHDRRREGLRLRDEQRGLGDERGGHALLVTGRQENRDAAAGRAEGRRHVPRRDAGQRRPSGAARVEVPAAGRCRRRDDQPRRHRRGHGQDDAPADAARLSPRDVRGQHRHGRVPLEP